MLQTLVDESSARRTLMESTVLGRNVLDSGEQSTAVHYVNAHPDFTAYHAMFAIRKASEERYASIDPRIRAAVLCSALAELVYFNDWGHLTVSPREGLPARALVELGDAALGCLRARLDDHRPAPFFGSADATLASQYRRSDFAYRAAATIAGERPEFAPVVKERDAKIRALIARLSR